MKIDPNRINDLIQKQKDLYTFVEEIEFSLTEISTKNHHSLTDISDVHFSVKGVSFTAHGWCWGPMSESFSVTWEEL